MKDSVHGRAREVREHHEMAARSILPDDPNWLRAANDRGRRQRPEIPTVKRVAGLPVHEKDVAVRDDTAAPPDRQRAAATVALARVSDRNGINGDRAADTADGLSGERQNALQERYAPRQVSPFGKERCDIFRGPDNDQIIDLESGHWPDKIETDRDARARVPDEPWGRVDRQRKR